ncbi:hypothetical protein Bbelb_284790 [Branchiostoma belcheri]|nr:hypothetical protein Bbelb_284790 [Branchiostoma belcheri]
MSQPRSTSNSLFFAQLGVDTFDARRRKLTHSFAARLLAYGNGIISLLLRSDAFPRSQFWPHKHRRFAYTAYNTSTLSHTRYCLTFMPAAHRPNRRQYSQPCPGTPAHRPRYPLHPTRAHSSRSLGLRTHGPPTTHTRPAKPPGWHDSKLQIPRGSAEVHLCAPEKRREFPSQAEKVSSANGSPCKRFAKVFSISGSSTLKTPSI